MFLKYLYLNHISLKSYLRCLIIIQAEKYICLKTKQVKALQKIINCAPFTDR